MFGMPKGSPNINHLAFPYDMIIMCKVEIRTMQVVIGTMEKYGNKNSGQEVNNDNIAIYLHKNISAGEVIVVEVATRNLKKEF